MAPTLALRARRLALPLLGAALAAGCTMRQTRRPGSDMVVRRPVIDPLAVLVWTQCRQPPAAPPGTATSDSLAKRQSCPVLAGDTIPRGRTDPNPPPQRVP